MRSRPIPSPIPGPSRLRRGMTLVEMLIAVTISGVVMTGMLSVFIQALKIYDYDKKKLMINRHIRKFTSELTESATFANYALIYPDFTTRKNIVTVTNPETGVITTVGVTLQKEDGQSGDMLVLAYVDPDDDTKIQRLVGYYRAAENSNDVNSKGPVRRFELEFSPSSSSPAVDLLPATSTINTWPEVIELSQGLSDGRLFHNFYGRSVMVKGEIIQGDGKGTRMATNTYNFTISPRG
ncbi:MAG: prepilin-type N-terminal cleavage/methylation domain-containing protein [Burkholderiales bacterium]|nr:prepilin-type N-terminal cleavage/methylation domain-containing protein [Opitutaceae bacterium]